MSRRLRNHRSFGLELLESREVLSSGGPTAEAQTMLHLINLARTDPKAAAQWVDSHLDGDILTTLDYFHVDVKAVENEIANAQPRPPVAWNDTLAATATQQSQDQVNMGVQTHLGADGTSLGQRLDRIGYSGRNSDGENAYAYSKSVDHAMEAFLVDWGVADHGHRRNIVQPDATPDQYYREVGIGIVNTNKASFGPKVITQDYGRQAGSKADLLGVAYYDKNGNGAYDYGEGQGNVEVDATNVATGQTTSTLTWDNGGGYQIPLDPGTYKVVAKVGDQTVRTDQVNISSQNIQVDYNLSQPWQAPPAGNSGVQPVAQTTSSAPVSAAQTTASNTASSTPTAAAQATPAQSAKGWFNSWSSWTAGKK